ncbi:MAG: hypothetical protein JXA25_20795 [Anaerolineales bacterium]|nr:hypothetical protein [Anaerolineales bacterium]
MFEKTRKNPRYVILAFAAATLYGSHLVWGWWLTPSRFLNGVVSIHILGFLGLLFYYLYYRYLNPAVTSSGFQRVFYLVLSAFLISFALAIWGFHETDGVRVFLKTIFNVAVVRSYLKAGTMTAGPVRVLLLLYLGGVLLSLVFLITDRHTTVFRRRRGIHTLTSIAFFLFITSILAYIFSTTRFLSFPGQGIQIYTGGHSSFILDRLKNEISFLDDIRMYGGFNYMGAGENIKIYFSRMGFYGSLLKLAQTLTKIEPIRFIELARIGLSFLMASVFAALASLLRRARGVLTSLVFILPIPFTFWILGPARILLWFFFLFFLPFLFSVFLYPRIEKGKMTLKQFYWTMAIVYFFVFLHGYEHISNVILSGAVPVFFYEFSRKSSFRRLFLRCFNTCLVGLAAFGIVFLLHMIQLTLYKGTLELAWYHIVDRTQLRVAGTEISSRELFLRWLRVPVFYFSEEHFIGSNGRLNTDSELYIHKWNSFGVFFLVFLILAAAAAGLEFWSRRKYTETDRQRKGIHETFNIAVTGLIAMFSSWTWFLAKGHMATHLHQNGIMFMFPFAMVFYILAGYLAQTALDLYFSSPRKPGEG